jgi:hypothetical protein
VTTEGGSGESPLPAERSSTAQAWKSAEVAMAKLKSLSDAFEEALISLQRGTELTAQASHGWSSCLALIALMLHRETNEARWLALSLLDEHSQRILHVLLSTMEAPAQQQARDSLVNRSSCEGSPDRG